MESLLGILVAAIVGVGFWILIGWTGRVGDSFLDRTDRWVTRRFSKRP